MNIGIVGSGMIVTTLLETLKQTTGDIKATTIYVREKSREKGKKLAGKFGIKKVYTDYQQLLSDQDIDFVYIGLPNQLHHKYTKEALLAGKNIILEKPFAINLAETKELVALAKEKKQYLFEAITSIYTPMFKIMKENIGKIGEIKLVQGNFSQYSSRYDRYSAGELFPAFDPNCYGGALYDLNVYNIHLAVALFGMPEKVDYQYNLGWSKVDTSGVLTLSYPSVKVVLSGAKDSASPCFFQVQGTKGYLKIKGTINSCPELEMQSGTNFSRANDPQADIRMIHELKAFEAIWKADDFNQALSLMEHSVNVMQVLEATQLYKV